ncbi:barstar family protein [Pantoea sp. SO10]|uniref:barstar family protein n=1 Tax=Pantoea sp. SO10 TaxID=2575375 RepID=UPI0010C99D69|nr:barstar family protein [Pantoea sp. SO10]QCP60802.1 barnase inhibitor [Pantoea sp. SO10]
MSSKEIVLDGELISSIEVFHEIISEKLKFGPYYGQNMNALWDRLSSDVERPVKVIWMNSNISKSHLGECFDKIINIFEETKLQDIRFNWDDKFTFELR